MRARPEWDRLAVWSYQQAGEEIPHGDPSVTDAERSAGGLPAGYQGVGAAVAAGRAPLPSRGMDRRPRSPVVGAAASRRAGLAAVPVVVRLRTPIPVHASLASR